MKILALEFSSPQGSAAVVHARADAGPLALGEAIETGARSTNTLGLVEEALRQAQLDCAQPSSSKHRRRAPITRANNVGKM